MKNELVSRFNANPLLSPKDIKPSREGLEVVCLLNPGAFVFNNKTWLIVRVAERPKQTNGLISFPVLQPDGEIEIIKIQKSEIDALHSDERVIRFREKDYLTTLSHLRLLCSDDGIKFYEPAGYPPLMGKGNLQNFGIEDCRVSKINNTYYLTFTSVSENGVGVGLKITEDWKNFVSHDMIIPPHNKDCAIFENKINGTYYALHRPSSVNIGGNYIWLASSPDAVHWGNHRCIIKTRENSWDSERVGAGAAPIKTSKGWLEIYHGANKKNQYCLGAFLMDLNDPSKIIARSSQPIMMPTAEYERCGFFGNVVFTNGHIIQPNGDTVTIYYGASDEYVCAANVSINEILSSLNV